MANPNNDQDRQDQAEKPKKYFDDQFDDESVLYVFRRHPIVMRKGLVLCLLGPLVGILPAAINPNLGFNVFFGGLIAGTVLGLLILAPSWIGWYFSVFILTDQRFIQITQRGLFHRSVADLPLRQIQSVNYEISGLEETLLGFGTIIMQTYVGDMTIHNLHHPAKVQRKIASILRDYGVPPASYPAHEAAQQARNGVAVPKSNQDNEEEFDEDIAEIEEEA